MGGALAAAASGNIFLYDKNTEASAALAGKIGASVKGSASDTVRACDLVFLGVKPNVILSVIDEIRTAVKETACTLVTMAAGISIASLEERLGFDAPIIRIMPNTPASIGEGMILLCHNGHVTDEKIKEFNSVMKNAGRTDLLSENLIDAASAVSGCGPAFVYMFIEALADGGVKCGLPRDKALIYAEATVKGAAALALESNRHPGALKDAVCSPGGTTIEGVCALEDGAFRGTVINAVTAAYEKTLRMKK